MPLRPARAPGPRSPAPPAPRHRRVPAPRGSRTRWQTAERFPKPFSMATVATGLTHLPGNAAAAAGPGRRGRPGGRLGGGGAARRAAPAAGAAALRARGPRRGKVSAPASARRRRRLAAALLPCFDHHLISTGNDMENGRKRRLGQTRTPQFRGRSRDSPAASQPGPGEKSRGPAAPAPRPAHRGDPAPRTQKDRARFIIQPAERPRKK